MFQLVHRPCPIRFRNGPFAMDPFGLDVVQPGALDRRRAHDDATAAVPLDAPIVGLAPRPHRLTDVPRGVVPHQPQRLGPFRGQPLRQPSQPLDRHGTDRPPIHTAEAQALCLRPSQPITRDRLGLGVVLVWLVLAQAQRRGVCPGLEGGLGVTAPPHRILKAQDPVRMPSREGDQAIAPLFFRVEGGAGLGIQCVARFPGVCRRWRARRMLASLRTRSVTPCSWPIAAARPSVPTPVGFPERRGDGGKRCWRLAPLAASSTGAAVFGRVDGFAKPSTPCVCKAWRMLRTVWTEQLTTGAMGVGDSRWALARTIWARRTRQASAVRRSASHCRRSSSVKGRRKRGGFIAQV